MNGVTMIDGIFYPTNSQVQNGYKYHPDYLQWIAQRPIPGEYETESPLVYKRDPKVPDWGAVINSNNETTNYSDSYNGVYPVNGQFRYYGFVGADRYSSLFSDKSIKFMSQMITNGLKGSNPNGKPTVVPDATIRSVADSVFQTSFADAGEMQKMVVSYIINSIKTEADTIAKNNDLSIWVSKYDTDTGMKRISDIKLNKKQRSHYMAWRY